VGINRATAEFCTQAVFRFVVGGPSYASGAARRCITVEGLRVKASEEQGP